MGFVDDFVQLPAGFKYIILLATLLGLNLSIPGVGFSIGDLLFIPVTAAFGHFGIYITFQLLSILMFAVIFILFVHHVEQSQTVHG